ncbi:hypothetical protein [Flavobacterium ginsenosidimutans]|uniref:hypothetical protein n=1 Tax=Flavobacterium ginsenosidimutans TaxID=687844 RepID=UPI000DAF35E6|nr:hypothetical protein [Flavobacterium ginsenosidimutans]KAF2335385.1 hypothetical protein DM444_05280 [Flavobacterium ginsenosidimutans]
MNHTIREIVSDQINKLNTYLDLIEKNGLEIKTIDIDRSYLAENYRKTQTFSKCINFKDLYDSLPKNKPVLYWFTFDIEKLKSENLEKALKKIEEITKSRKVSEVPKARRECKGTLYVGKVKDKFHYRFVNHLGHSINDKTGSLQLTYWYDPLIYGNLQLNYIVLEQEMKTLIGILEIELAKKLKPILGSHKN